MSAPKMDYDAESERSGAKRAVRSFHDAKLVETFRFHGLSLADMDRAELLGVISFLAANSQTIRTVKIRED